MKKILSVLLSVLMLASMLCSMPASATESTTLIIDETSAEAVTVKAFLEENNKIFDGNYFFIESFSRNDVDEYKVQYELTTNSSKDVKVAVALYGNEKAYEVPYMTNTPWDSITSIDEVTIPANGSVKIYTDKSSGNHFPVSFAVAVQNSTELTGNFEIELKATGVTCEITGTSMDDFAMNVSDAQITYGQITVPFDGPVSFKSECLKELGEILTSLNKDKPVVYTDVVSALKSIESGTIEEIDTTVNEETGLSPLDEALTDDVMKQLSDIIDGGNKGKKITTNNGDVTVPYIALTKAPAESGSEYAVNATKQEHGLTSETYPTISDGVKADDAVAYDIKLLVDGNEQQNPTLKQRVEIAIPNGWDSTKGITYKHGDEANWNPANIENGKIVIYADGFSVYTFAGVKTVATEDDRAESVTFEMIQDETNKNEFILAIKPVQSGRKITNFVAAAMEYQIKSENLTGDAMENFTYTLYEVDGIRITDEEKIKADADKNIIGGFKFVATAIDAENPMTDDCIEIAKLTINGTGNFKVRSGSSEENTGVSDNNIYCETLVDNQPVKVQVIGKTSSEISIPVKKYKLNFDIDFGKAKVETDDADYLGMVISIEGSVSGKQADIIVGSDLMPVTILSDTASAATVDGKIELPANETYTFEISAKGYRKFADSVYLDSDKKIKMWSYAKDQAEDVVVDDEDTAEKVTFLVGDIYLDGKVDIYDLSAVTSYYNANRKITNETYDKYVPYDLNRDGYISLTDIAYVQVSYGY